MPNVTFLIGVPCSGKSSYRNTNLKDYFSISRDDIRDQLIKEFNDDFSLSRDNITENLNLNYSDLFKKPNENENEHPLYGLKTEDGQWSILKHINQLLTERFNQRLYDAIEFAKNNGNVVIDLLNLSKKEREELKSKFSSIKNISFNAIIFEFEKNMDLIKKLNTKRGQETGKVIPDHLYTVFVAQYNKPEKEEFDKIIEIDGLKNLKKQTIKNKKG